MIKKSNFSICIHGGAGVISKDDLSEAEKKQILTDLNASLMAGEKILASGGSAVDAVAAAVVCMENSEQFNAGKGAVYTRSSKHLLEASLMDGRSLQAGAVANCKIVKNPILFAKSVMERDDIVMISNEAADQLAQEMGHAIVENSYFDTEFRKSQLTLAQKLSETGSFLDHSNLKKGTVGAVAFDQKGNLAAATSTGGMTNKMDGRIGDTAIIGCGTYANNKTCAVSCTGIGEFFIRATVASMVSNLMEYGGYSMEQAAKIAVNHQADLGGDGGVISVNGNGEIAIAFNSEGMYRGFIKGKGSEIERKVFIWNEEETIG